MVHFYTFINYLFLAYKIYLLWFCELAEWIFCSTLAWLALNNLWWLTHMSEGWQACGLRRSELGWLVSGSTSISSSSRKFRISLHSSLRVQKKKKIANGVSSNIQCSSNLCLNQISQCSINTTKVNHIINPRFKNRESRYHLWYICDLFFQLTTKSST